MESKMLRSSSMYFLISLRKMNRALLIEVIEEITQELDNDPKEEVDFK